VHYLGDELRIAVDSPSVDRAIFLRFVVETVRAIKALKLQGESDSFDVVSVITEGQVLIREWRNCRYVEGPAALKAHRWMGTKKILAGQIGAPTAFQESLSLGIKSRPAMFDGEAGKLFSFSNGGP